jgi:3-oxoacyl-[acyl-carrier-protein] synthase III
MTSFQFSSTPEYPAIIGVGTYLPEDAVSNSQLIARTGIDSSDEDIQRLTGIRQRHIANGEFPSEMGAVAAKQAIGFAQIDRQQIGGLYVSTMTRDMVAPDTAVFIHQELGLREDSIAMDIGGICAGGVMSLYESANRLREDGRPVLAVGLGPMTPATDFSDRRSCILFGDGAGAFVVGNVADDSEGAYQPVFHFLTNPDPQAIFAPGPRQLMPEEPSEEGKIAMRGRQVAAHAVDMMPRAAIGAAKKAGLWLEYKDRIDWDQITAVVPHQANARLIERVGAVLKIPEEKVVITVDQHANTSAASVPLALAQAVKEGRFNPNGHNRILITAVGSGMVAGACIIDVRIPPDLTQ